MNAILENSLTWPVTLMWMSRPVICKVGPVKSENTPKVFLFFHAICLIFYCLSCLYQSLLKLVLYTHVLFFGCCCLEKIGLDKKCVSETGSNEQKSFDLQQKIEYSSFSISQKARNFNRLAGLFLQSFTFLVFINCLNCHAPWLYIPNCITICICIANFLYS